MIRSILFVLVALVVIGLGILYALGTGMGIEDDLAGEATGAPVSAAVVAAREQAVHDAGTAVGVAQPKQILFGDLHVHTTFSFDAFQLSLPMAGGDGAHPVSDACDFARHCAALDFWSINDHALVLTERRWSETVASIRQCNAVTDPAAPDLVSYLG